MQGFKKLSVSGEFKPAELPLPAFIKEDSCVWNTKPRDKSHRIYFTPNALHELDDHIHWGIRSRENRVEQGGLMVGNVFKDPDGEFVYAIVDHLVPMHDAKGSPGFLEMDTNVFSDAIQDAQKLIDHNNNNIRQIGWYHTHPNGLDVFMSGTDRTNQRHSFSQDWQFAVVLNPHRKICRAFHGGDVKEAYCCFLCLNDPRGFSVKKFRDLNQVPFTSLPTRDPKPINTKPIKIHTPPQKLVYCGKELPFAYDEITGKINIGKYHIQEDSFVRMLRVRLNFMGVPDHVTLAKLLRIGLEPTSQGAEFGNIHVIRETTWFDSDNCLNIEYGDLRMEQDSFWLNLYITNNPEVFGSVSMRNLNDHYPLLVLSNNSFSLYDPNGPEYQENPSYNPKESPKPIPNEDEEASQEAAENAAPAPFAEDQPSVKKTKQPEIPTEEATDLNTTEQSTDVTTGCEVVPKNNAPYEKNKQASEDF